MTKRLFLFLVPLLLTNTYTLAQRHEGIHVSGGASYDSIVSSNIGTTCFATGLNSFAGGYQSYAQGSCSFAFGNTVLATQPGTFALGSAACANASTSMSLGFNVTANQNSSFVIGSGASSNQPLTASVAGITMGMGSTHPTLYLSKATTSSKTGKVAIGNVTPQAKLHIRSDAGEDAGIILVPAQPSSSNTFIRLRDNYHSITVNSSGKMSIISGSDNQLGITSSNLNISENLIDLGFTSNQRLTLSSGNIPSIGSNACPTSGGYSRNAVGPSYVFEFGSSGLLLRTANYIEPRHDLITNWRDALSVKTDGTITFNGKVGVNTENTTRDYAFAVDGGIITTKVHIQDVTDWNDRVFDEDYPLMPLGEMEAFISSHHHLPGILSETEVKTNGFDMAEMQSSLLGKVEELVLYTIKQQKEIDSLREVVTVHFGYDECGNRISRTLEFQRMNEERRFASLTDTFVGIDMAIFPNPTEGGFVLSLTNSESLKSTTATLCSLDGTVLERRAITSTMEEFDLSNRPAGIYLLHLSSDGAIQTWKIIKRN